MFTLAVGASWLDRRTVWVRTPLDLPFFLLVGWILITIPFATDPAYSFSEWRKLIAQMLVFYWVLLVVRRYGEGDIPRQVLAAVVVGTVFVSLYALVDFVQRNGSLMNRSVRAWAPSSDSNWLTSYLVIGIPLVVSSGVVIRTNWRRLTYFGAVLSPALLAHVFSYMRAGWLALVIQGIAFAFFTGRRRLALKVIGLCLAGVLGLLALSQVGYQKDTVHPLSLNIRLAVWKLALEEVATYPLVGIGYGNDTFVKRFKDFVESAPN
ncbi:MAG: O-antigen ligase family protein, partial [Nitrospiraceae bacterium]